MSSLEILSLPLFALEPEVTLLACDETRSRLTFQVMYKDQEKLSVRFDFVKETDTAEEVVKEMVGTRIN